MKKIIIDTLGADKSAYELAYGGALIAKRHPELGVVLVGPKEELTKAVQDTEVDASRVHVIATDVAFGAQENPKQLLNPDNHSSLALSLSTLKQDNDSFALISSGSTGGLMVGSIFRLGLLGKLKIPALGALLFSFQGNPFALVDCGANLDVNAFDLVKFATMGSVLMQARFDIVSPRVALLNVGAEPSKGDAVLRDANQKLKESPLHFVGNIEGYDLYQDKADVVVTSGLTGNIVLKLAESMGIYASQVAASLKDDPNADELSKKIYNNFAYTELGASILLGTKKICLKCHGSADRNSILETGEWALRLEEHGFIPSLDKMLSEKADSSLKA